MSITLNSPNLPYTINRYYQEMIGNLCDQNIYDKSPVAIPAKSPRAGSFISSAIATVNSGDTLTAGTYYYVVVAVFNRGEGSVSNEVVVVIAGSNNSAMLQWTPVEAAVSYKIFRSTESNSYTNTLIGSTTLTNFTDSGYNTSFGEPCGLPIILSGSVSEGIKESVSLYCEYTLEGDVYTYLVAQKDSNDDGTFSFSLYAPKGMQRYYVSYSGGSSPKISVNAYNLHLFFEMIAKEMQVYYQTFIEKVRAGAHIDATKNIYDGNMRDPDIDDLKAVWGEMTSIYFPSGFTLDEYRTLLKTALGAYRDSVVYAGIKKIFDGTQNLAGDPRRTINLIECQTAMIGTGFKFFTATREAPGASTMSYQWNGGNIFFGGQRGYIKAGTATVVDSGENGAWFIQIVYIDGERDATGAFKIKTLSAAKDTLGGTPAALPWNCKVLAAIEVDNDNIVWIHGQGRLGYPGNVYNILGQGPFHVGPHSFITSFARLYRKETKQSRFFMYFDDIFGSGYGVDPEYLEKVDMIKTLLSEVKPAKMTIAFGCRDSATPWLSNTYTEV